MFDSIAFAKKYMLALLLIAILSILAYFNLNHLINKQSHDGEIINMSGKQRFLSQQIALFAVDYKMEKLNDVTNSMEMGHNYLISLPMTKELRTIYYEKPSQLDKKVKEYIYHAKFYYENRNEKSLLHILENSQLLLIDLDEAVLRYQLQSESKVSKLKDIELYLLLLTLLVLICEAIFIFEPASVVINKKTHALINEKNYSDTITESNTNAIIVVDSDFKVRTFNKSAVDIFGYSKEEMIGSDSLLKIVPEIYKVAHKNGLMEFFKAGKFKHKSKVLELSALRKNGEEFPIRISFGANENEKDKIVVANIQDITDEVNKDAKILQQSRYAAMGEMIGNIAHQWRQPLSSISAMSSGAKIRKQANVIDDNELMQVFDKITNQTKYLSETIDNFRDFFKGNENQTVFEISKVIGQSILLTEAINKHNNIKVIFNEQDKSLLCKGSEGELSQVFMNLINNSKDILIENKIEERIIFITLVKDQDEILINYYDNANGINPEIIGKIFEPYFTTKHKSQGTGIGLFMSKEIIDKHFYGSIVASNKEFSINDNKYLGACFTIKIPLVKN